MFASHRFPQRTLLDALVQSASMNSCKHSQRTQQHNCPLLSTASVFLGCSFPTERVVSCSKDNFSPTHQTARFLFSTSAQTSSHLLALLQVSILVLLHRATTHNVVVFPSTAVDMRAPCNDPNETHTVLPIQDVVVRLHTNLLAPKPNVGVATLAVGPFANSLWTSLQLRCAQHDDRGTDDVSRSTSPLLGIFG